MPRGRPPYLDPIGALFFASSTVSQKGSFVRQPGESAVDDRSWGDQCLTISSCIQHLTLEAHNDL